MVDTNSWHGVKAEVIHRITTRQWQPGDLIPGEEALASEFGCARVTVNRALRRLAEEGLLERRRKAGTRVVQNPVARVTIPVPVVRAEVSARGDAYSFDVLAMRDLQPSQAVQAEFGLGPATRLLGIWMVHRSGGRPFAYEERWLNLEHFDEAVREELETVSADEYLARHLPSSRNQITFGAVGASKPHARFLQCEEGAALFSRDQTIWAGDASVSSARLIYAPGHTVRTTGRQGD